MSQVIQDSDEEEDVSIEELPATTSLVAGPEATEKDILSTRTPSVQAASSSENLRRQMRVAQLALVEPTPSRKRRATEDFDASWDKPSDSSTTKRRQSTAACDGENYGTLNTYTKKKTPVRANLPSGLGDVWNVPEDIRPGDQTFDVTRQRDTQPQDERHSNDLQSPHDTIADSSSLRHATSSRSEILAPPDSALKTHNPNELFPNTLSTLNESNGSPTFTRSSVASGHVSNPKQTLDARETKRPGALNIVAEAEKIQREPVSDDELTGLDSTKPEGPVVVVFINDDQDAQSSAKPISQKNKKRKADCEGSVDELNSDELVGLPKETYNPRPTRSRGARKELEHPVFASPATPIRKSNSKLKRLKTTGSIALAERTTLCEMGFRPSQADEALVAAEGDINRAVELLTNRGYEILKTPKRHTESSQGNVATLDSEQVFQERAQVKPTPLIKDLEEEDDESPVPARRRQRRGRDLTANFDNGNGDETDEMESEADKSIDAEEQDSTPETAKSRKSRRSRTKPKKEQISARKDELEVGETEQENPNEKREDDDELNIFEAPQADYASNQPKKKGRGRPKKASVAAEKIDECIIIESQTLTETLCRAPLEECDPNQEHAAAPAVPETGARRETSLSNGTVDQVTPEKNLKVPPASPKKPHSPINSGRVPLKVGLSRRARIEPLLRIVKK